MAITEPAPAPAAKNEGAQAPFAQDDFSARHIGPDEGETAAMLAAVGFKSLSELCDAAIAPALRAGSPLRLEPALSEADAAKRLSRLAEQNQVFRSFIGLGYSQCLTPAVIRRNVLENPGWYTAYTPYQAEIAQGRLEALLNFQTLVVELTGLPVANASLLDEATAAAEAMHVCHAASENKTDLFLVSDACHPQTIAVVKTRAQALGIAVEVGDASRFDFSKKPFGVLLQYPETDGRVSDPAEICARAHERGTLAVVAADPLSLVLLKSPGDLGADIAVGSLQRFGVPMGAGGPHAAYFATRDAFKRLTPGRVVGVSKDAAGKTAYRLALQTREQHIRREKATSNICTAQVLLAVISGFYAAYHGPKGLARIARGAHALAAAFAAGAEALGYSLRHAEFFDAVRVKVLPAQARKILAEAAARRLNLRVFQDGDLGVAFDEAKTPADVEELLAIFAAGKGVDAPKPGALAAATPRIPPQLARATPILPQAVFNLYHSETEMLRYIKRLESRDLSLTTSMIPLGSCTMKLNAASEMLPITLPGFSDIHPFAPPEQTRGYQELLNDLGAWLCAMTGFAAVSFQPNAGSQGEYAGLLAIRAYQKSRGQGARDVCLIPASAHGTNPASAAMAGLKVVTVATTPSGDIDLNDLKAKAVEHTRSLCALMVTYPSTHGVFEEGIKDACMAVHAAGGQVYLDGANMNAMVGLCRPAELGADVCHLNLHKTFCIPHGGGGPGMGPIAAAKHLAPHLPGNPAAAGAAANGAAALANGPVAAAPWGSAMILPIPWAYIAQMGADGLLRASQTAILNANYVAKKLEGSYPVLFRGRHGLIAHECILDLRRFKDTADVSVEDVAKRLMDYGFHAPTVSWPVPGTMMIEPTESESKAELDRFCEAMILIREEIRAVEEGRAGRTDNPLKNAPHTALAVTAESWTHPYSRGQAAFPAPWLKEHKFWPAVARIDNAYGDRNFVCACS